MSANKVMAKWDGIKQLAAAVIYQAVLEFSWNVRGKQGAYKKDKALTFLAGKTQGPGGKISMMQFCCELANIPMDAVQSKVFRRKNESDNNT